MNIQNNVQKMVIDEEEEFRPTKYGKLKTTKTDHNSVMVDIRVGKVAINKEKPYFNTKCESGQLKFQEEMEKAMLDELFIDKSRMNSDYKQLMKIWNDILSKCFKKVRKSKCHRRGLDHEIKQLMLEKRGV